MNGRAESALFVALFSTLYHKIIAKNRKREKETLVKMLFRIMREHYPYRLSEMPL